MDCHRRGPRYRHCSRVPNAHRAGRRSGRVGIASECRWSVPVVARPGLRGRRIAGGASDRLAGLPGHVLDHRALVCRLWHSCARISPSTDPCASDLDGGRVAAKMNIEYRISNIQQGISKCPPRLQYSTFNIQFNIPCSIINIRYSAGAELSRQWCGRMISDSGCRGLRSSGKLARISAFER